MGNPRQVDNLLDAVMGDVERRPFVVALPGVPAGAHEMHAERLRTAGAVAVAAGDRIAGVLPGTARDLTVGSNASVLYAVGEPVSRADLRSALDDLRALVDVGLRLGRTGRIHLDDHLPEVLLARSPRIAERLRRRALGPLEAHASRRRVDLLETLHTFLACDLDRRRAAKRLQVHPNTLDYRLRRVEELTGLRVSRPADMVLISLALIELL